MPVPDPHYDFRDVLPAGQVLTRERELALAEAWADNGYAALSDADAVAAVGAAIAVPTSIRSLERCA